MKQKSLPQDHYRQDACDGACFNGANDLGVVDLEERSRELKLNTPQLYSKEAEYYSFYYAFNIWQGR